jgi:hypothetical protein
LDTGQKLVRYGSENNETLLTHWSDISQTAVGDEYKQFGEQSDRVRHWVPSPKSSAKPPGPRLAMIGPKGIERCEYLLHTLNAQSMAYFLERFDKIWYIEM